jgi:hypothetical protein
MTLDGYREYFRSVGIRDLAPGFFDDPAFLDEERRRLLDGVQLLALYARYVDLVTQDDEYVARVRPVIDDVCTFLAAQTFDDHDEGRCVPMALLVSRFLESEGVWNYIVKGGVVVRFPRETGLRPKFLDPIFGEHAGYGHAWVVAPALRVIDLTIHHQFYNSREQNLVHSPLLASTVGQAPSWPFAEPPPSSAFAQSFPPARAQHDHVVIDYYPTEIGGPNEPFAAMPDPRMSGKTPYHLYDSYKNRRA